MITIVAIILLLLVLIGGVALYIVHVRKQYAKFYCPKYTNIFLAHAKEIVKAKKPLSETFLDWSRESGDDVFVLFSSWRVHIHIVNTTKIKAVLCSRSLQKPDNSRFNDFCGINVLGLKSLLTEPGTHVWTVKRKTFDPYFHAGGLRKSYNQLLEIANDLVESVNSDEVTNLTRLMQTHVSFVIAHLVMEINDKSEFYLYTDKIANIFSGLSFKMRHMNTFWMPWTFRELKTVVLKDLQDVRSYFKTHILSQKFEEIDLTSSFGAFIKTNMEEGNLKVDEMVNDMVMFFFAGIDTSTHAISFAFYEMLRNRHVLAEIEEEIRLVFGERESVSYDEVKELKYLDSFLREVLRFHPIVFTASRITGPKGFDLCGEFVPKNTNIHVNIECVQKSEKYWKEPLKFSVDRWTEPPAPFSYIPFSGGTRSCIGRNLALLEIKVFISSVLRKFTIDFDNSDLAEIGTKQVVTNRLARDLMIQFKRRD